MTTQATSAQGVLLQRNDGFGQYQTIAEVKTFSGPSEAAKVIDVTSVDSPAHEYINGLIDGGEVTMECNFVGTDSAQQGLRSDLIGRVRGRYKIILNDPGPNGNKTAIAFEALVMSAPIKGAVDQVVDMSVTLKVTGLPVFTYAN